MPVTTLRPPDAACPPARPVTRRRRRLGAEAAVLVLGATTAIPAIARPALWFDEAASIGATHQLGLTARESGGTMAPYYVLLRAWSLVSSDPRWLRLLSLALGLSAVALFIRVSERWVGRSVALASSAALVLSYLWAQLAGEARSYTLALLLTVAAWDRLDRLMGGPATGAATLGYGVICVLLPLTHGLAALVVGAQVAALLCAKVEPAVWRRVAPGVLGGTLVTVACAVGGGSDVTDWVRPTTWSDLYRLWRHMTAVLPALAFVVSGLAVVTIAGARADHRTSSTTLGRFRAVAPTAWAAVPTVGLIALSLVHPTLVSRYLFVVVPAWALLAMQGVARLVRVMHANPTKQAVTALLAIILLACAATTQAASWSQPVDEWDRAAAVVAEGFEGADAVLMPERRNRMPFEAAWADRNPPVDPTLLDFERPLGTPRYVESAKTSAEALRLGSRHERIWVVYQYVFAPSRTAYRAAVGSSTLTEDFSVVDQWTFDRELNIVLYERGAG
ncbi:hypothetical protein HC251_13345 [Iamia sp. SCSIO 61187]|uniref:hypothetical protein n=1 Tax=Iamia sp. SCSIO 61187 TaxID=2722752 RepID=UPI001C625B41|nr:hypothetical protein [Iamia sp. SCSIO 61187]QYG93311.1 hypothetical protein HC251_13345 [Iamia sp. SCSIO 61187]